MKHSGLLVGLALLVGACATESANDPTIGYEELRATTILDAPGARPGSFSPETRAIVMRGEYLVELLGCGTCHTDGALVGDPDLDRSLAGSRTGIAYANPLGDEKPGVIYPPNITPDSKTGIGDWSDTQIADAIRAGIGRHVGRRLATMPWQGYAKLSDDDTAAIVSYLRAIDAVEHRVPDEVEPGQRATNPFVYFGIYRSKE
jgi:mono/diheme cytochrome c family protein